MEPPSNQLTGLTVVEFGGSVAGAYCARMFALQGADVSSIGEDDLTPEQRRYLRQGVADLDTDADIDWPAVDIVIESRATGPLTPRRLDAAQAVRVQLSPFGSTGPYATWSSSDLVDYAISGHSYLYGDPAREPLGGPPDQPAVAAGLFGFIGAMAALFARTRLGHGQVVEVSHLRTMVALHQVTLLRWMLAGDLLCRMGNRYTGQGQPNGPYPCADGWISIVGVTEPQIVGLLAVTGLLHLLDHPEIDVPTDLQHHPELLDEPLNAWLASQTVDEVVELFQAMRIPACPLRAPGELIDDPQLVARDFFHPVDTGDPTLVPGPPFTLADRQPTSGRGWTPGDVLDGPLAGLRVLDLARVWAGPLCARILSDLGAEVIWVEAPGSRGPRTVPQSFIDGTRYFPDNSGGDEPWNRNGHLIKYSLGKRSLAIDLQTEAGRAAFERLVPDAHVLLENFSSRVMPQFGLDQDRLHELNPDLVYLTMPGYGRSGPAEHWLAYGSCVDSHAGLSNLIGYAPGEPWKGGVAWPDPIAGLHACSAVLGALWSSHSNDAGGCTIEAAQFESTIAAIGDQVVRAQTVGPLDPTAPRDGWVTEGTFRCAGEDSWIAISVPHDREDAVRSLADRLEMRDTAAETGTLDEVLANLASSSDAMVLAEHLQHAGVAAGPVQKAPGVMADAHLDAQDAWVTIDQPAVGDFVAPPLPIDLSETPARIRRPGPTLGQHNEEVLREHGFEVAEIAALAETGVIADRPPASSDPGG